MDNTQFQALTHFLTRTTFPSIPRPRTTLFEISGQPHYENRLSDFYAFFFRSEEDHGLGTLFFDALLDLAAPTLRDDSPQRFRAQPVQAQREVTVGAGRIDLIVHTGHREGAYEADGIVFVIENKVFHHIEGNNLTGYDTAIQKLARGACYKSIILGLNETLNAHNWPTITHQDFAHAVKARLGQHVTSANQHYLPYLTDFLENISRFYLPNATMPASATLFFEQLSQFQAAARVADEMSRWLPTMFIDAFEQAGESGGSAYHLKEKSDRFLSFAFEKDSSNPRYTVSFGDLDARPVHQGGTTFQIALWYGQEGRPNAQAENDQLHAALHARLNTIPVNAPRHQFAGTGNENDIIHKTYSASILADGDPVQVIADIIRRDWQPLEDLWTSQALASYGLTG